MPGLVWSCLVALALVAFDSGVPLTITVALLGLFLYPDQPILTASILDFVGSDVASTGLGLTTSIAFLMGASSSLFGGLLYETRGFEATAVYIAVLFAAATVTFLVLPIQQSSESPPAVR